MIADVAHADCQKSILIQKGETVTDCDRIGFSVDYAKEIKKQLVEGDYLKRELEGTQNLLNLEKQLGDTLRGEIKALDAERLRAYAERDKQADRNQTVFWVGMGVGIAIPIIAAVIIQKVVK